MKTNNTNLNGSTHLQLGMLKDFGVAAKDVDRIRDQIHKSDQFALDMADGVSWSRIVSSAKSLDVALPTDALTKIFSTRAADAVVVQRVQADYPVPSVSRAGNDAKIAIDSNKILLAEGGGAKIYKKAMLEWLFLRRTKSEGTQAGFELHGFQTDKIAIDIPPGGALIIVDSKGNQRGYNLRPAEITHSMMGENTPFTVKVLDKAREVVLEQTLAFDGGRKSQTSKHLISGTFSKRAEDDAQPERPRFSVGGENGADRVLVARDGKAFPIERYEQLLAPPKMTAQAFKAGGTTFMVRPHNGSAELDDPAYSWMKTAQISSSNGHGVTMDWSLSQSHRAKWTAAGFEVFKPGSDKPFAVFDPFFGS